MRRYERDVTPEQCRAEVLAVYERISKRWADAPPIEERPDEAAERRLVERLAAIGVPARHRHARLATSKPLPALERAKIFLRDELPRGRCLVLAGPPGGGKTHALCCILAEATSYTRRFHYMGNVAGIILDGGSERRSLIAELQQVPLLILDDLGVEHDKRGGMIEAALDRIFWGREANELPTAITCNLTPTAMHERYSPRVMDRLRASWGAIEFVKAEELREQIHLDREPDWVRQ